MGNALFGKVRDDHKQFRPMCRHGLAENLRKPQIIANERRDGAIVPAKGSRALAGEVMRGLTARRERPHLGLECEQLAGWREYQRIVTRAPIELAQDLPR